ncbi:hypothetical protein D3C73_1218610 [compost metagenome]
MCWLLNVSPKKSWNVVPPSVLARRDISKPNTVGLGIPEMPSGPPVSVFRLMSSRRIISPKPKVTIAR